MLKPFTVALFGHRYLDDQITVENLLENVIKRILDQKEYVLFLVGRNGEFDQCASSTVLRMRKKYREDNSELVLLLPYLTAECKNNVGTFNNYYTNVEISYKAAKAHPKSAIQIRNREMVDRADLIVCYVDHKGGGAYETLKYAKKRRKTFINLFEK